jgi:hypothetical protein
VAIELCRNMARFWGSLASPTTYASSMVWPASQPVDGRRLSSRRPPTAPSSKLTVEGSVTCVSWVPVLTSHEDAVPEYFSSSETATAPSRAWAAEKQETVTVRSAVGSGGGQAKPSKAG